MIYGIGFGSIEAILLGISSLSVIFALILVPENLPNDILVQFAGRSILEIPAPIIERISAGIIHIFTSIAIIYGVKYQNKVSIISAFILKSLVDAIATWGKLSFGIDTLAHL